MARYATIDKPSNPPADVSFRKAAPISPAATLMQDVLNNKYPSSLMVGSTPLSPADPLATMFAASGVPNMIPPVVSPGTPLVSIPRPTSPTMANPARGNHIASADPILTFLQHLMS